MSILSDLGSWIMRLIDSVKLPVIEAFEAALHEIASNGGEVLTAAASAAVAAAEQAGGTGAEKFAAARTAALTTLESQGLKVAENALQMAILAAVSELRAKPQTEPAPEAQGAHD